ncbi:MAG: hypothetical protein UFD47_05790 [Collinsella aerofaciens]|nr:hypothetical protein [Collinsella aerofaciens]
MENFTYSVDVFIGDAYIINAGKTNSIFDAYRCFTEKLELVESDIADSVVIFEFDDLGLPHIIATVNSFDC